MTDWEKGLWLFQVRRILWSITLTKRCHRYTSRPSKCSSINHLYVDLFLWAQTFLSLNIYLLIMLIVIHVKSYCIINLLFGFMIRFSTPSSVAFYLWTAGYSWCHKLVPERPAQIRLKTQEEKHFYGAGRSAPPPPRLTWNLYFTYVPCCSH